MCFFNFPRCKTFYELRSVIEMQKVTAHLCNLMMKTLLSDYFLSSFKTIVNLWERILITPVKVLLIYICTNFLNIYMFKIHTTPKIFLLGLIISILFTSCLNSRKVAYFSDVSDSARIAAASGLEPVIRSEEHTSELQSRENIVCRL